MRKSVLSMAVIVTLGSTTLVASTQNMAESLMKIRADVEELDASITDERDAYKSSMSSLLRQKNDLESVISRENLKIKQIERELGNVRKEIKEAGKNSEGLKPLLVTALDLMKENIKSSLPFKTKDRLADIEKIKSQLENDLVTPQKALALTWNAYADAIRMSKENGIFKQTINISGQDRLAEVARIGTVAMFFRLPDDSVGQVSKDATGWYYKEAVSKKEKEQILALFDSFKKQIRSGFFTLPNTIVMTEAK
ncbi:DUF3450 family protein [Sulfurimonas sp. MAG313]|nr:DUF3450 family protein [Sulfurimonas sp. MAG313]MDF1881439.1 DUF3450 family protein [Sulfurimonas sp. MAG313]